MQSTHCCLQAMFVLAGGMLPHALEPRIPPIQQFVFSYHSPNGSTFTIDPYNPSLLSRLTAQGCSGRLYVQIYALMHVVHVEVQAPLESFTEVTCPTMQGFQVYDDHMHPHASTTGCSSKCPICSPQPCSYQPGGHFPCQHVKHYVPTCHRLLCLHAPCTQGARKRALLAVAIACSSIFGDVTCQPAVHKCRISQ